MQVATSTIIGNSANYGQPDHSDFYINANYDGSDGNADCSDASSDNYNN